MMRIAFAASECVPYINTGGLADVLGALPREVARQGHHVTMYLPFYKQVSAKVKERVVAIRSLTIPFQYYNRFASILDGGVHDGVQFYFVDCPELFDREYVYATPTGDYQDNWERFGLFSRAVLESAKVLGVPDVFHVHDWETAILPVFLRTSYYFDPLLRSAGTLLTVHNAGFQGWFPPVTVERLLLPWEIFTPDHAEHYNTLNFLKGGVVYADLVTTVSRKYAEELQTAEFGNGLEGTFQRRANDLHGILNGIDTVKWDPATDGNIAAHYTAANLEGKAHCRRDLLHAFGLEHAKDGAPVLGIVSRFTTQKGFDLIAQVFDQLAEDDIYLAVLGDGEPYYENLFLGLQERHPGKISARIPYDRMLAHKVCAGADIFLMPSRYEPCGLGQLYALRYGTVPVVRATGGLDEAVAEWNAETKEGTGFKFHGYEAADFLAAIRRAVELFKGANGNNKADWQKLIRNCMAEDHSWPKPAAEYIRLYEEVARRRS